MTLSCQPLPRSVAEEMLQVVARALCDRPNDTAAQRDSRTRQMVHSVLGCEPRDGAEYMLSSMLFGHFQMILDAMRDVLHGESGTTKARTRSSVVALDREFLGILKELRELRHRPGARLAQDTRREATAPMQDLAPQPDLFADPQAAGPGEPSPERVTPPRVRPAATEPTAPSPTVSADPRQIFEPAPDHGLGERRSPAVASRPTPPANDADSLRRHISELGAAMREMMETPWEVPASDQANAEAPAGG